MNYSIKLFFTLEVFAFATLITSVYVDSVNRTITGYGDEGWTTYYTIPKILRAKTRGMLWLSGILACAGVLALIWL